MAEIFLNNSYSSLSGALASAATELDVSAATGVMFPSTVAPDYFYAVLARLSDGKREVIKVIERPVAANQDKMTIERAAQDIDGITAVALDFVSGDAIFATPTATFYAGLAQTSSIQDGSPFYALGTGTNSLVGVMNPVPSSVGAGHRVVIKIANTNTGAMTLDVGPGAVTVQKLASGALVAVVANDVIAGTLAVFRHNGTVWELMNPNILSVTPSIPSGTKLAFPQNAAPTGWTFVSENNDTIFINSSTEANGGVAVVGGTWTIAGFGVTGSTILTSAQSGMPAHTVTPRFGQSPTGSGYSGGNLSSFSGYAGLWAISVAAQNAASGHDHPASAHDGTWRPLSVNVISCTKD